MKKILKDGYYTRPRTDLTVGILDGKGLLYSHETKVTSNEHVPFMASILEKWNYSETKPL